MSSRLIRILIVLAGVMGADGVMLAAASAHQPDAARLASASSMLLFHAAAVLGTVALAERGVIHLGIGIAAGWGFFVATSKSWTNWRIAQVARTAIHSNPFINASWTYKPTPDWSIKLGADNFIPYRLEQEQINYSGPRSLGGVATVQDVFLRTRPRLYVQLRTSL